MKTFPLLRSHAPTLLQQLIMLEKLFSTISTWVLTQQVATRHLIPAAKEGLYHPAEDAILSALAKGGNDVSAHMRPLVASAVLFNDNSAPHTMAHTCIASKPITAPLRKRHDPCACRMDSWTLENGTIQNLELVGFEYSQCPRAGPRTQWAPHQSCTEWPRGG